MLYFIIPWTRREMATSGLALIKKTKLENTVYELMLDECSIKERLADTVVGK